MERLTFEGNFCDIEQCRDQPCPYNGACSQRKVWERLKAYEDTGITAEEVNDAIVGAKLVMKSKLVSAFGVAAERLYELAEADKDKRVVVLPCKVGDTVYWVHSTVITECRVHRIQMNRNGLYICLKSTMSHGAFRVGLCLGKTVFLTREEAEAALRKMGG